MILLGFTNLKDPIENGVTSKSLSLFKFASLCLEISSLKLGLHFQEKSSGSVAADASEESPSVVTGLSAAVEMGSLSTLSSQMVITPVSKLRYMLHEKILDC